MSKRGQSFSVDFLIGVLIFIITISIAITHLYSLDFNTQKDLYDSVTHNPIQRFSENLNIHSDQINFLQNSRIDEVKFIEFSQMPYLSQSDFNQKTLLYDSLLLDSGLRDADFCIFITEGSNVLYHTGVTNKNITIDEKICGSDEFASTVTIETDPRYDQVISITENALLISETGPDKLVTINLVIAGIYNEGYMEVIIPVIPPPPVVIEITNCIELQNMQDDLTADYILANDIDCIDTINWNLGAGFDPIVDNAPSTKFEGTLNGNGYTISNLFINRPTEYYVGFIRYLQGASINNVVLLDVDITGYMYVGGLAGYSENTDITKCGSTGVIKHTNTYGGGLFGYFYNGIIRQSFSSANVVGENAGYVGGLVGFLKTSLLTDSYANGNVSGNSYVGGLSSIFSVEGETEFEITNSYATGKVIGVPFGGLVNTIVAGSLDSVVDSYWDTESSEQTSSNGGEPKTTAEMISQSTFTNWDFINTWTIEEDSYPCHKWYVDQGGSCPIADISCLDPPYDLDFVFDKSTSMDYDMGDGSGNQRLEIAQLAAKNFINQLFADDPSSRIGLTTFCGSVSNENNLGDSSTQTALENSIDDINMCSYTNYYDSIVNSVDKLISQGSADRPKMLIFITDGDPTWCGTYGGYNKNTCSKAAAQYAAEKGIYLFAIGIANTDFTLLNQMTQITNGQFATAESANDLNEILDSWIQQMCVDNT